MRTRIPIEPDFAPLEHIFDPKIVIFLEKFFFFLFFDKSAGSADINEKMLGKVVFNLFDLFSII